MKKKQVIRIALSLFALLLVVTACTPTPEVIERTIVETRVIEVEGEAVVVEVTRIVTEVQEVVVQPTPVADVKTLTIGMSQEPTGWGVQVSQIARIQVEQAMNANLTYRDGDLNVQPWLAEKVPSLADGDWVLNDDGTMEVTWRLREGITWHDGTPLTVEDVIFGWEVMTHPEIPAFGKAHAQKIERIEVVDERTFVAHWSETFIFADQSLGSGTTAAPPLPAHLLRDVFEGDKERFRNHPYWSTEFVGTGPFRLTHWEPGSHIILEAYDAYFLGRPRVDRVVWRFIADSNTLMANIITGHVDVSVIPSISFDQALIVNEAWERTGSGTVEFIPGFGWDWIALNRFNDPNLEDVRLKQALMYGMDRETLVEVLYDGFNPVAHSPIAPRHPLHTPEVEASMIQYEYDPERATQLLAEAGWTRAADGFLTNAAGERLTLSMRTIAGQKDKENAQAIIADHWQDLGIRVEIDNLPSSQIYVTEHLFHMAWPSAFLFNFGGNPNALPDAYTCDQIPSEENNWSTANLGQFCDEDWDRVYHSNPLDRIVEASERARLLTELMPIWTERLPFLPLYYKSEPATYRTGVTGVWATGTNEGWTYNIHEWDIE
jgi:peptide/nickel transport system substrate-binding protein